MILNCFVKSIVNRADPNIDYTFTVEQIAQLDARSGYLEFLDGQLRFSDIPNDPISIVNILIGNLEFELLFDQDSQCIAERSLADYHDDFQTLYQAQAILGLSGIRTYH